MPRGVNGNEVPRPYQPDTGRYCSRRIFGSGSRKGTWHTM